MENLTEIVFILDRSGSMAGLEGDTIGGFNAMIKKQQEEIEGKAFVSTVLFDHESLVLHDRIPLNEIKPLTQKDYEVRGTTALLDAVGDAVKHKYSQVCSRRRPPAKNFVRYHNRRHGKFQLQIQLQRN